MEKLTDTEFIGKYIGRQIKAHMEGNGILLIDVAARLGISHSNVSATLNGKSTSSNTERYEKLAMAAGMSKRNFDNLVAEAKRAEINHTLGKEEIDEDFALKSLVGNSPEAQAEAKSVIQYIKQKYGLK